MKESCGYGGKWPFGKLGSGIGIGIRIQIYSFTQYKSPLELKVLKLQPID